ncbi:MAG: hypothetical protein HC918_10300 [Oscillatoriales cyanobacterium SM2_1_8]|nr:hypothetical protein [Oscillatoriales cyanobacterium SM2_1_8]
MLPVQSQGAITRGTIVQIAGGGYGFVQTRKARLNDVAQSGQQIRTEQATAQVEFNNRSARAAGAQFAADGGRLRGSIATGQGFDERPRHLLHPDHHGSRAGDDLHPRN